MLDYWILKGSAGFAQPLAENLSLEFQMKIGRGAVLFGLPLETSATNINAAGSRPQRSTARTVSYGLRKQRTARSSAHPLLARTLPLTLVIKETCARATYSPRLGAIPLEHKKISL